MKKKATQQKTPNNQKAPYDPISSCINENHLVTANPNIQQTDVVIELAADFTFGGNISPKTAHGKGPKL